MAHLLIIKSKQNSNVVRLMLCTAADILIANGHTYDEIQVCNIKEIPVAINVFTESNHYDATICIGATHPNVLEDYKLHYQEVLRCIYDYSTYFGHLIGNAIVCCNPDQINDSNLTNFTQEVVNGVCDFLKLSREINSMEGTRYGSSIQHN